MNSAPLVPEIKELNEQILATMKSFAEQVRRLGDPDPRARTHETGAIFDHGEARYMYLCNILGEQRMGSDTFVVLEKPGDTGHHLSRWFKRPPEGRDLLQDRQHVAVVPDTFFVVSPEEGERLVGKDTVQLTQAVLQRFQAAIEVMESMPTDPVS